MNTPPPVPKTFFQYLRSFGPGLVVVLTWLGAGDVVDAAVAGGNYGYSLMWVMVLAIGLRFLFVSLIAKYQLCNPHGEGVLDGLGRLHPWYPPLIAVAAVVMGHVYGSYMAVGIGEACANLSGTWRCKLGATAEIVLGQRWQWAVLWNGLALAIVFRPLYPRVERVFLVLLALLSISFLGTAAWVGPNFADILRGMVRVRLPGQSGPFDSLLVAVAMVGAVGGSLMNLVYPYFLEQKGWRGPQYRRVQLYDFALGITMMMVLNLSVWTLGAELLHPHGRTIERMDDLPQLLSQMLGPGGRWLFYVGIFAAIYTSVIGHALGLGYMASHAVLRWNAGTGAPLPDYRSTPWYRWVAAWCLVSPLLWTLPGMPEFVTLTLIANSAQVVLVPVLAGGLWCITANSRYIGKQYRNRWWENLVMAILFAVALWAARGSIISVRDALTGAPR